MGCQGSSEHEILLSRSFSRLVLVGDNVLTASAEGGLLVRPLPFPTYSSAVYLSDREIYVSGGLSSLGKAAGSSFQGSISAQLVRLRLEPSQGNVPETQFLKEMKTPRYAHASTVLFDRLFVIGGRTYDQEILSECECYDLAHNQWADIAPLNVPRVSASAVVFRQRIYVFGGYCGNEKRSRKIERYSREKNLWEVLAFKMPMGLEASLVLPCSLGRFLVLGGHSGAGPVSSVFQVDLTNENVEARPSLIKPRFLAKGFVRGKFAYVFGGCEDHSVEVHGLFQPSPPQLQSDLNLGAVCTPIQLRSYAQALYPLLVLEPEDKEDAEGYQFEPIRHDQSGCVLFGTDAQPFLASFNFTTGRAHRRPSDLRFGLRAYQSAIGVGGGVLVCGGINSCLTKVSRKSYLYNPENDKVVKSGDMLTARYGHGLVRFNGLAFAVGGKSAGEESLLGSVECWQQGKWLEVGQMRKKRSSPGLAELPDGFLIYGGYGGNGTRLADIEIYSVRKGFTLVEAKLPIPIEGPATVSQRQIFVFGGRLQDGDSEQVWKVEHSQMVQPVERTFEWAMSHAGKLSRGRANPKLFFNGKSEVFVFGVPNRRIEVFSLKFCSPVSREHLGLQGVLQGFEDLLEGLEDQLLKTYSLAQTNRTN